MKLDKRIRREDIFDCFNAEKAEKYIGERGYFSNNLCDFSDLVNNRPKNGTLEFGTLGKIHNDLDSPYYMKENVTVNGFFIPESVLKPKPKEKQYRALTIDEFKDKFHIGQPISFRKKGEVGNERYLILNGYSNCKLFDEITTDIYIGRGAYTLDELFNKYEWQASDTEDFQPFGVEE